MRNSRMICFTLLLMLLASFSFPGFAQTDSAEISGRVTDPSGALVRGAVLSLRDLAHGTVTKTQSNSDGIYIFPYVRPGQYSVSVEANGFRRLDLVEITANTQDHLEQNFTLTIGSASESMTVSSEARVDVGTSVSTSVDQDFVKNMPLNGRDFQSLIAITPGAVRTSGAGLFSFNGQRDNTNYFTVDGVSANTGITQTYGEPLGQSGAGQAPELSALGTTSSLLSLDALDQIKIQSANYMPEYGRSAGGQIQLTSRGGTEKIHGSLFDYLRNDDFDAMNSYTKFLNATTGTMLPKPPLRMNDFGGTFGGPVMIPHFYDGRNRTFFFFSYEGLRLKQPTSGEAEVPPLDVRNAANIYPELLPYIDLAPPPNIAADQYGNPALAASYSNPSSTNNASLRVDEAVNSRLTFFARYAYAPSYSAVRSIYSINEVDTTRSGSNGITVGSTFQINSRMVNEFRANWTKVDGSSVSTLDNFDGSTEPTMGMYSQMFPSQFGASTSNSLFTFGAYPSWSFSYQVGTVTANTQRQVNLIDSVSYQKGSHNIKVGVDWRYLFPIAAPTVYSPNVAYYDPADLLSGDATVAQVQSQDRVVVHQQDIAFYAEDSWRVKPHLLLNYGVRYDLDPAPHAVDGQSLYVVANPADAMDAVLAPAGTPMYKTNKTQFAPRVGVAYELTNVAGYETLFKAGYGLFYVPSADTALQATNFFPHDRDTAIFGTNWFTNPLPPIPASLTPPYTNQSILGYYPGFTTPRTHEWNVSVQQNIGRAQSFTMAYVGSAGRKLTRLAQFSGANSTNDYLYLDEFYAVDSSDYNSLQLSYVRKMSHGLQVLANYVWGKSMDTASSDTVISTSPTGLSVAGERGLSDFNVKNSVNVSLDWKLPTLNTSHRYLSIPLNGWGMDAIFQAHDGTPLTVTLGYELPTTGTTSLRPDLVAGEPIWISAPKQFGGKELNPAAFSYAYALTNSKPQGDEARNAIPGLNFSEFEYTVRRDFKIKDKINLQYRCDFFNMFNQTNYAAPSTELGYVYNGGFTPAYQFGTIQNTLSSGGFFGVGGARQLQMALRINF